MINFEQLNSFAVEKKEINELDKINELISSRQEISDKAQEAKEMNAQEQLVTEKEIEKYQEMIKKCEEKISNLKDRHKEYDDIIDGNSTNAKELKILNNCRILSQDYDDSMVKYKADQRVNKNIAKMNLANAVKEDDENRQIIFETQQYIKDSNGGDQYDRSLIEETQKRLLSTEVIEAAKMVIAKLDK